jgi:hypothetical protein
MATESRYLQAMKSSVFLLLFFAATASAQRLDVLGGIPIRVAEKVALVLAPEDGPAVPWADGAEVPAAIWPKATCAPEYVDGWRLPTRAEWNLILEQAQPDWGLNGVMYWTSEQADDHYAYVCIQPKEEEPRSEPGMRHKQQEATVRLIRSVD